MDKTHRLLITLVLVLAVIATASTTALVMQNKEETKNIINPVAIAESIAPAAGLGEADVERIVERFLMKKPEVVISAIEAYRAKQQRDESARAQENIGKYRNELERDENTPVVGNPDGDVTVVKFSDYSCGYCKRAMPEILKLLENDKNVRVVIKDFPILGPQSEVAARAALAAHALDSSKYWDFHAAMLKKSVRNKDQALSIAAESGYDREALSTEMEKPIYQERIERNRTIGQAVGVRGTPAFVINGQLVPGYIDYAQMKRIIDAARK